MLLLLWCCDAARWFQYSTRSMLVSHNALNDAKSSLGWQDQRDTRLRRRWIRHRLAGELQSWPHTYVCDVTLGTTRLSCFVVCLNCAAAHTRGFRYRIAATSVLIAFILVQCALASACDIASVLSLFHLLLIVVGAVLTGPVSSAAVLYSSSFLMQSYCRFLDCFTTTVVEYISFQFVLFSPR